MKAASGLTLLINLSRRCAAQAAKWGFVSQALVKSSQQDSCWLHFLRIILIVGIAFPRPCMVWLCVCVRANCEYRSPLRPSGLNGRPVCTVRDDWNVTSSLFPHPLLKSHSHRKTAQPSFAFPSTHDLYGVGGHKSKSGMSGIFTFSAELCFQAIQLSLGKNGVVFFMQFTSQRCFPKPGGMNLRNWLQECTCLLKRTGTKIRYN